MTKETKALIEATVIETLRRMGVPMVPVDGRAGAPAGPTPALLAFLETRQRVTIREVLPVLGLGAHTGASWTTAGRALIAAGWHRTGREKGPESGPTRIWFYERRGAVGGHPQDSTK